MTAATLALSRIAPDPKQPRKHFDLDAINELADSIREQGLIQPIVVRPVRDDAEADGCDYWIIAGERRYRACRQLGLETVDAIVRTGLFDADVGIIQVVENLQRQDLSLGETAAGVRLLVERLGNARAASQLGKSEGWVSKHAGIAGLPDEIRELIDAGCLFSADGAHELARLKALDEELQQLVQYHFPRYQRALDEASEGMLRRQKLREHIECTRCDLERIRKRQEEQEQAEAAAQSQEQAAPPPTDEAQPPADGTSTSTQRARINDILRPYREHLAAVEEQIRALGAEAGHQVHAYTGQLVSTVFNAPEDVPELQALPRPLSLSVSVPILRQLLDWLETNAADTTVHLNYTITVAQLEALRDSLQQPPAAPDAPPDGASVLDELLRHHLVTAEGSQVKAATFYDVYRDQCTALGVEPLAFNDNRYGRRILDAGIRKKRTAKGVHYLDRKLAEEVATA